MNMTGLIYRVFFSLLLSMACVQTLHAAPGDPVEVEADQLDIDQNAGTAVYSGDVRIRQGDLHLNGARVEIQRNANGELSRAIALGDRAYIRNRFEGQEDITEGHAQRIIYHVAERRVELVNQAELSQGGDRFTGGRLEYFIDRGIVQARSDVEGGENQRIRMTLQPEQQ